jgi:hypothetical protein
MTDSRCISDVGCNDELIRQLNKKIDELIMMVADRNLEIKQLRDQVKIVKQSRIIHEYELQNMNATNHAEYIFYVKDKLAIEVAYELIGKNFITFEKEKDLREAVTVTAILKVVSNDAT